jgi:60 kDa SS-A/Ro ribonucleoprotein
MRLSDVVKITREAPASYADCSAPMRDAMQRNIPVDAFVIYTDNDTNSGEKEHPIQALDRYRQKSGINAKLIVVSMASNGHSIADPADAGTLDITGFDGDTPTLISDFVGYQQPAGRTTRKVA